MSTRTLRHSIVTVSFVALLLAYFLAATSSMAAVQQQGGSYQLHGFWHVATALSVFLGGVVLLHLSHNAAWICYQLLEPGFVIEDTPIRSYVLSQACTARTLEQSFIVAFGLSMVSGYFIINRMPASMVAWWELVHRESSRIQGPIPLISIWAFYTIYWLLIRQSVNLLPPRQ